jgi:hypothetical protein
MKGMKFRRHPLFLTGAGRPEYFETLIEFPMQIHRSHLAAFERETQEVTEDRHDR